LGVAASLISRRCFLQNTLVAHDSEESAGASVLPRARGRGSAVPDWRDPPPRAPGAGASSRSCLGPTRCSCAAAWVRGWDGTPWLRMAHAARIHAAPLAVGAGRVLLENMLAVMSAERFSTVGLALSPRDPQDRGPSTGFLSLPGHSCLPPWSNWQRNVVDAR
jgi:hypothetical protein